MDALAMGRMPAQRSLVAPLYTLLVSVPQKQGQIHVAFRCLQSIVSATIMGIIAREARRWVRPSRMKAHHRGCHFKRTIS